MYNRIRSLSFNQIHKKWEKRAMILFLIGSLFLFLIIGIVMAVLSGGENDRNLFKRNRKYKALYGKAC